MITMLGLLGGSGTYGSTAQHAADQAQVKDKYSGLLGWVQDKLGLNDQEMRDLLETGFEKGGGMEFGMSGANGAGQQATPVDSMAGLLNVSKLGRPGQRRNLPTIDLAGLLGGGIYG